MLDAKVPMVLSRNTRPGFRINLHIKDLTALAAAQQAGVPLPLAALAPEMMHTVRTDGLGDADHSALIRFYEKLAGVEVGQAQVKEIVAA